MLALLLSAYVHFRGPTSTPTLVVNKTQHILKEFRSGKLVATYSVCTGFSTSTPTGTFRVVERSVIPGSGDTQYGARWIGLSVRGFHGRRIGIHGTNAPATVGTSKSQGCIRMFNKDIIQLFSKVPIGTKVIVVKGSQPKAHGQIAR